MDISSLDGAELLHLAVEASRRSDHGKAIDYLKQALDLPAGSVAPSRDYARLEYFLGAEYAQIGMVDRAAQHMAQAVEMDPQLHTARFQLGLLYLTCARPQEASAMLAPLAELGPGHALFHMRLGLEHLMHDEFDDCRRCLLRGMELNASSADFNAALNGDMQKIIGSLPGGSPGGEGEPVPAADAEAHFRMSAYHRKNQAGN